jgi:hypothetical protein
MTSESSKKWVEKRKKLVQEFDELLDSIDSSSMKEKILWKQIYMNSIDDRNNALLMFGNLFPNVSDNWERHTTTGDKLAKYLERAEKSNEQLLKLATLIRKALETQVDDDQVDVNDLFDQIESEQRKELEAKK